MVIQENKYEPINCGFHDYLEHFATLRKPVTVVYQEQEERITLEDVIIYDLSGGRKGEYAHIIDGSIAKKLRMDFLISIDGVEANQFNNSFC